MTEQAQSQTSQAPAAQGQTAPRRRRYVPAVGPRLRRLLYVVFALFALLTVNAIYLSGVTFAEWLSGETWQDFFYQYMFLAHLILGVLIIVPVIVYGAIHIRNTHARPNRRAVKVGYTLFAVALVLLASGLMLTRGLPWIELRDPQWREWAYWIHLITPLLAGWLFVLHRLAGKRINWRFGGAIALVSIVFAAIMIAIQSQDPRSWGQEGPEEGEQYFFPSLARTSDGNFIDPDVMMMDDYCAECHADVHERWAHSMHRFASFNNPVYLFSVRNTRAASLERDGDVRAARFCAGCHDLVPFFSGAFDDPNFDDVNHPTAQAGITCTGCHAITHVNSPRGNADYTIEAPLHYPFATSENPALAWINRLLVKAKPEFHKKTFLKPLHRSTEFCGSCHKVHLPETLNAYRWIRGQNHYDSFLLSGVSGHGVRSFYYPPQAETSCNGCHMELLPSDDFGAFAGEDGVLRVHDHQFPSANTAIPQMLGMPDWVNERHREMLEDSLRVDLFAIRKGGTIDGELMGPIGSEPVALEPGESYLLEVVVRTLTLGHLFTQGTADSNEVWVSLDLSDANGLLARSGGMDPGTGAVDPNSFFINAYVLDRHGNRIDRRNAEDIFIALYNHQIPPGAAATIHFRLDVPADAQPPLTLESQVQYRKFDTTLMQHVQGDNFERNDLPITRIADTRWALGDTQIQPQATVPLWQRWNDYGIGLLRNRQFRQAEEAFAQVEALGNGLGSLNLARTYIAEGRLAEARDALQRAQTATDPAYPWVVTYWTGVLNLQNGFLDEAIENFTQVEQTRFNQARARGFDFSKDYRLLDELGRAWFERAKLERGAARADNRTQMLNTAAGYFERALQLDPERAASHYALAQVLQQLQRNDEADHHLALHERYKVDDNARDQAIARARARDPAADQAANEVTIYELKPWQAPGPDTSGATMQGNAAVAHPSDASQP